MTPIQREMIELASELDGPAARTTLLARSALAVTLHESGRDADALVVFDENIPLLERELGAKHPNTLIDEFNRVETLNAMGRHADALAAGRALHPRMVEVTGPDHPFTLETEDAIGYALTSLGILNSNKYWLIDTDTALWGTILANIWVGIPFNMLLLLGGLQGISPTLYEAASTDGA